MPLKILLIPMTMNCLNNIFKTVLLLVVMMAGLSLPAAAADAGNVALADSAYASGRYDEALEIYNKIASSQGVSAPLYFNMGNAYYKKGDSGNAVLCYLRALRLDPSLSEANDNLTFLRSHVEDVNRAELGSKKGNVSPDEPSFWRQIYESVTFGHLPNTWAVWAVVSFLLFIAALAAYIWSGNVLIKKIGFFSGMVLLAAVIVFIVCAFSSAKAWSNSERGVVVENRISLLKAPGDTALVASPLHAGTELSVLETKMQPDSVRWYLVRLNSDIQGWIPASAFSTVVPDSSSHQPEMTHQSR